MADSAPTENLLAGNALPQSILTAGDTALDAALTSRGNVFVEAVRLAGVAYENTTATAETLGWDPVDADALDIEPVARHAGGVYRMGDGIYVHADDDNTAVAHVYTGELDDQNVLALAFRGTDEAGDIRDHASFTSHFVRFEPLVTAAEDFARDPGNAIDQVLVTGHSLGAAMVTTAMFEEGWITDDRFIGVAIASHGTDSSVTAGAPTDIDNLFNFMHEDDILLLGAGPLEPSVSGVRTLNDPLTRVGVLSTELETKERAGVDVWIDTGRVDRLLDTEGPVSFSALPRFLAQEHALDGHAVDIAFLAAEGQLDPEMLNNASEWHFTMPAGTSGTLDGTAALSVPGFEDVDTATGDAMDAEIGALRPMAGAFGDFWV